MAKREYFGCKVAQRGEGNCVEFVMFVASAREVMKWAGTRRVGEHHDGTQRVLKQARVRQVTRFLDADERNTLPTNVTIAFSDGATEFESRGLMMNPLIPEVNSDQKIVEKLEWGILRFEFQEGVPEHERLGLIVDGQHRLHGMANYQEEELPVLVSALINASLEEQAFQFVVINNKASKVPTDNVKAIVASQLDETELQRRLLNAGVKYGKIAGILRDINNRESSPFKNMLDWPLNEKEQRIVSLTAVEKCMKTIAKKVNVLDKNNEAVKEVFLSMWGAVKERFQHLWGDHDKFMSKVNIISLNEYLSEKIAFAWEVDLIDVHDLKQVESHATMTLAALNPEFWEKEWNIKLHDSLGVRTLIKNDLQTMGQNSKNPHNKWYSGLSLPKMK
ncbi:MAG: DGQHR domain-containing protein [Ardenticatenaceae bacterium]